MNDGPPDAFVLSPQLALHDVTSTVARIPLRGAGWRWRAALLVALGLLALYLVAAVVLFARGVGIWGVDIPVNWGFAIANYVWWLGIAHAGTLISGMLLVLERPWRNSINRFAEAMTLCAATAAAFYPILHLGRPWYFYWMFPYPATTGVWPQFRSPLEWDIFALLIYFFVSLLFWYLGLLPDLATMRDRARRPRWAKAFGIFALGWRGDARHWQRWRAAYDIFAAVSVPLVACVVVTYSVLFAAGQAAGWHSTIFPFYFLIGAVFSGLGVVTAITVVLRGYLRLGALVTGRHLNMLACMLLATGMMSLYCYASEVFSALYSDDIYEVQTLLDRFFGPKAWSWWGAVGFSFVPLQLLWWRAVRRRPAVLFFISISVVLGMWFERYMIVVTGLYRDFLTSSWGWYSADLWEWFTFAGSFGVFLFPYLLFLRYVPVISMSEDKKVLQAEKAAHG